MTREKSIWGDKWAPFRKWVYPAWFVYETSKRFYDQAAAVHNFLDGKHEQIAQYIGDFSAQALDVVASAATFGGCELFLTVPATIALHRFFKEDDLPRTKLERKLKRIF